MTSSLEKTRMPARPIPTADFPATGLDIVPITRIMPRLRESWNHAEDTPQSDVEILEYHQIKWPVSITLRPPLISNGVR